MTGLTRQENQRMALTRRLTDEYTPQGWSDRSRGAPGVALNRRLKQESRKHDRTDTWTGPKSRKHGRADSFEPLEQVQSHENTAGPTASSLWNMPKVTTSRQGPQFRASGT